MTYSQEDKIAILSFLMNKIRYEVELAFENNDIDDLVEKYGVRVNDDYYIDTNRCKVLVIGALSGKKNDFVIASKKMGINPDQIEFESDYSALTHFSASSLRYSTKYSDIIVGPMPHKMKDMGDCSSLLAEMTNNPDEYPTVIRAEANNELKITISSFKNSLSKTRLMISNYE